MEFVNRAFKIVTAFSPIIIMLVSIFQWKATDKQNNQNLFKMRMDYLTKFHSITTNIAEYMTHIKKLNEIPRNISEIELQGKQLLLMASDIELLYGKNIVVKFAYLVDFIFGNLLKLKNICNDEELSEDDKEIKVPRFISSFNALMFKQIEELSLLFKKQIKF